MKCKKIIACVLSALMLSGILPSDAGNNRSDLFHSNKVSAADYIPYDLEVELADHNFTFLTYDPNDKYIPPMTVNDLTSHTLFIYLKSRSKSNSQNEIKTDISPEDCTFIFPEKIIEGENQITISYCDSSSGKPITLSKTITITYNINVIPYVSHPYEGKYKGEMNFNMTSSVAHPGDITYLDINIDENYGFSQISFYLTFKKEIFRIRSISATSDLIGENGYLSTYPGDGILILPSYLSKKEYKPNVIRIALEVSEDAREGEYYISINSDGNLEVLVPSEGMQIFAMTGCGGHITVSKTLESKTNVSNMPLNRIYANFNEGIVYKTGDTTGDGSINAMDAVRMIRYFLGTDEKINNADVDENGKINIADYFYLKNYIILR